jgi:urease accessory protein
MEGSADDSPNIVPDSHESQTQNEWLVWQLADSAFPTGSFAHSNGLEAAWQHGEVCSCEELMEFVRTQLSQTGRAALPFLNEAYHDVRPFAELDRICDAFLSNHVANRGSRAQGQAFLMAVAQSFGGAPLGDYRSEVLKQKLPGHLAPVFGTAMRLLQVSHCVALRLFLFLNIRTLLASAVRLGIAGPLAAQAIQVGLCQYAEEVACRCGGLRAAEAAQTSPLLELWQGAHDRLYSRLFQT